MVESFDVANLFFDFSEINPWTNLAAILAKYNLPIVSLFVNTLLLEHSRWSNALSQPICLLILV